MEKFEISPIGKVLTDFDDKFGIPRQARLVESLKGKIVLEPEFAKAEAVKGLDEYSHLYIIWQFSENAPYSGKLTVRPPALGGNTRVGVFATRSPFRPNGIGLSIVKLDNILYTKDKGPVICVSGIDMVNGTPVIDIKPYIPMWDAIPHAKGGHIAGKDRLKLSVFTNEAFETQLLKLPEESRAALIKVLENDPRPAYQNDPDRIYGLKFAGADIRFRVRDGVLYPLEIIF